MDGTSHILGPAGAQTQAGRLKPSCPIMRLPVAATMEERSERRGGRADKPRARNRDGSRITRLGQTRAVGSSPAGSTVVATGTLVSGPAVAAGATVAVIAAVSGPAVAAVATVAVIAAVSGSAVAAVARTAIAALLSVLQAVDRGRNFMPVRSYDAPKSNSRYCGIPTLLT